MLDVVEGAVQAVDDAERGIAQGRDGLGSFAGSDAARILVQDGVATPVQIVLDALRRTPRFAGGVPCPASSNGRG